MFLPFVDEDVDDTDEEEEELGFVGSLNPEDFRDFELRSAMLLLVGNRGSEEVRLKSSKAGTGKHC